MKNRELSKKELITNKLWEITKQLHADFSAIAFYDPLNQEFRWRIAIGSLNNRYTNIVVRKNRGICGMVIKTKRECVIRNFPHDLQEDALEYPILIIEELKSSLAVPLIEQTQIFGVMLIGQRSIRHFTQEEIDITNEKAKEILDIFLQEKLEEKQIKEDKKSVEQILLFHYFAKEMVKREDRLKVQLLDQRITLLSEESQHELISIFDHLFAWAFKDHNDVNGRVVIESNSEQQFTVQFEINQKVELKDEVFSFLAAHVRKLSGYIELTYEQDRTLVNMNFQLVPLIEDQIWA